ncbi:MAG: CYTH domain-containing protein, partial [Pseudomonadota bacterium]|nr:CYTH domain-containing protein [Pseudomonadota bacterium]
MSLHHETELKLDFAARDLDRIRAHPAFASAGPVTRIPLHAIYFDTPARALFARAIALRMRANGVRRVMTLKAENGPSNALAPTRREWEWIVQGTAPRLDWLRSGESGVLLDGIDLDDLTPVFEVKVERVRFEIEPEPGTRVEVAIDTGEIRAGTRYRPVCEIEFELINGRIETLFDMARALLDDID